MTDLNKMLKFDALTEAERLTGQSYKTDADTMALGMMMHMRHSARKEATLAAHDDTALSNRLDRYQRIICDLGFELVLEEPFKADEQEETLFIYAHRDGILLHFDSFTWEHRDGPNVNGGNFYYNLRQNSDRSDLWSIISSGHINDGILIGNHDCREAIRHNIGKLRESGSFVTPWVKRPFLWLLNYSEPKVEGYDYHAINAARIARLPEWVREFVGS